MMKTAIRVLPLPALLLAGSLAVAQPGMILYNMADLPQRNQLNPALTYFGEGAVSIPFISSPFLSLSHSGFAYSDFIRHDGSDSLYMDPENMIGKLDETNYLNAAAGTNLFGFSLRLGAGFLSFEVTEKAYVHMSYSRELMDFLYRGNAASLGKEARLDLGLNFTHRRDYALTYALKVKDRFVAGARIKYLYGMENISAEAAHLSLFTHPNTFALTAKSNILIHTSGIESNSFEDFDVEEYMFRRDNKGWGLDLGAQVFLTDRLHLTASIVDLGKITWRSYTTNYVSRKNNSEFTYSGIDINAFFADTAGAAEIFDHVLDTLESAFNVADKQEAYETGLPAQTYSGLGYVADTHNSFHLLAHTTKFGKTVHVDFSAAYCHRLGRWFSVSSGLSYVNAVFAPGLGAVLSLNSFQFYLVSDNIAGVIYPTRSRSIDARAGINFVIGRKN